MKKLGIFLLLLLLFILLISCKNSTEDSSSVTSGTTSKPSATTPSSSSAKLTDTDTSSTTTSKETETQITSTSEAIKTQPISTSEVPKTEPTVIKNGFVNTGGLSGSLLQIAYEMPRSCSLLAESVPITIYYGVSYDVIYSPETFVLDEHSFKIGLFTQNRELVYHFRTIMAAEVKKADYLYTYSDKVISFSHSETIELPLSLFSESKGNLRWYSEYFTENEEFFGSNYVILSYEKIDGETIVFFPHSLPQS